jgi:hypothetical protein
VAICIILHTILQQVRLTVNAPMMGLWASLQRIWSVAIVPLFVMAYEVSCDPKRDDPCWIVLPGYNGVRG